MINKNRKSAVWAGCSDFAQRVDQARKNHEDFQASDLKKMLDDGWELKGAKATHKRPRIQKENFKVVMVFNKPMKLTLQEYNDHFVMAFGK